MKLSRRSWFVVVGLICTSAFGEIAEDRVLILVNNASPTSHFVAALYRDYHPGIPTENVVYLNGLPDIATSADEIITRANFETYIAQPVRQYLVDNDLVDHIWVIVTTAGMPYRIEDTTYPEVIEPHACDGELVEDVMDSTGQIDAASVESELAILWQIDPALDPNHSAPLAARIVNPYHGYISPMSEFCGDRDILGRRETFRFEMPLFSDMWVFEGQEFSFYRATAGRQFCVKDMYLVARLDGPRSQQVSPKYYISRMLESAARVSDPNHEHFHGYDPAWSAIIVDDAVFEKNLDSNKWRNAGRAFELSAPPEAYLTAAAFPTPPNVASTGFSRDDFRFAYRSLTGDTDLPDPSVGMVVDLMGPGRIGGPVLYDPARTLVSNDLNPSYGVGALCSFGVNAGGGVSPTYLLDGGSGGSRLVFPVYGAIFNSLESYNAVTFFGDVEIPPWVQQGLIWQWFQIQGSGALGHVFEPLSGSVADNDLLLYNYFRDADGDGVGDMTFVEAAYSALPCVGWAGLVVGDPLMRIHRVSGVGPGWNQSCFSCGSGSLLGVGVTGLTFCCAAVGRMGRKRFSRK